MNTYLVEAVAVMGAVTLGLRAAPFVVLQRLADSPVMRTLGVLMPPGVMVILVLYSVTTMQVTGVSGYLPAVCGIAVTAAAYHWKRNALLGIVAGTAAYMALLHFLG
ncbi:MULTISPECIES: branched-chain amino acid transporter permease [unclassified Streptomyces]|uniref:branched-chain amino acid transporter permease n=1 Tax=unclassified Streptomyces TaxID=2593676 RepID=UPI0038108126